MRNFVFLWLFILGIISPVSAQSGRKPEQNAAASAPQSEEIKKQTDYSESVSRKDLTNYAAFENQSKRNSAENIPVEGDVLKIETNLVTIPVSVFDRNGAYISNLSSNDFKIFEDGKEQEIAYFATSEKPFTVVLLLDTSPSTEYKIEEIRRGAIAFVDQLKAQDKVMVIEFDANINVLTDATNDRQKIYKAINKADFGGGTSLYEAVDFSLRKRLNKITGKKAIVLFTDGVDTTSSKADYRGTLRQVEEADVMIFPIYYNTFTDNSFDVRGIDPGQPGTTEAEYELGRKYLLDLAASTGGRVFLPEAASGGLTAAFEGIAEELRRQYNLGYYPDEAGKAGQRKLIKVRVNRPNLVIRARDSYVIGAQAANPK
jgi:VWFA-related protein